MTSAEEVYATPVPDPPADHGSLLRYQEVVPSVADSSRTYRIAYQSTSIDGRAIVVTGTALVSDREAPAGGRTRLSIGHGTTGVADDCAPSLDPSRFELSLMAPVVAQGWLVVQTDYEGLGTPGRHPYLVGASEGRSMLDAARAAASLPRADAGPRLGLGGYSQGGHAALWADRLARQWTPELEVIGTFAGAPATDLDAFLGSLPDDSARNAFGLLIAAGYLVTHPSTDPGELLTPAGLAQLDTVDRGCLNEVFERFRRQPTTAWIREGGRGPAWQALAAETDPSGGSAEDPVLIIHSLQDEVIPVSLSERLIRRLCIPRAGTTRSVERRILSSGGTHGGAGLEAYRQGLAWLEVRDHGGSGPASSCGQPGA